jgi:hypothetical protein
MLNQKFNTLSRLETPKTDRRLTLPLYEIDYQPQA